MIINRSNTLKWTTGILFLLLLIVSCSKQPDVSPEPKSDKCKECDCKEWRYSSPYFSNEGIFEAKGVANPSPNFQKQRDDAIQNGVNTLSTLWESNINSYTEKYVHEYQDFLKPGTRSQELFDRFVSLSNQNTLKRMKMDECEEPETGRYWVFAYISTAAIDVANAEAALALDDYILQQRKEEFREIIKEERAAAILLEEQQYEQARAKLHK